MKSTKHSQIALIITCLCRYYSLQNRAAGLDPREAHVTVSLGLAVAVIKGHNQHGTGDEDGRV